MLAASFLRSLHACIEARESTSLCFMPQPPTELQSPTASCSYILIRPVVMEAEDLESQGRAASRRTKSHCHRLVW